MTSPALGGRVAAVSTPGPKPKRRRLNFACNYCRTRKTRCDEQKPSCHACIVVGIPCITQDRRRPDRYVERREAGAGRPLTDEIPSDQYNESDDRLGTPWDDRQAAVLEPGKQDPADSGSPVTSVSSGASNVEQQETAPSSPEDARRPPDELGKGKYAGALPMLRYTTGTTSLEVLTDWLDLAFYRLGQPHRLGHTCLRETQAVSAFPLTTKLHSTPTPAECTALAATFLEKVNTVFPVVDGLQVCSDIELLSLAGPGAYAQSKGVFSLLRAYLVLASAVACQGLAEKRTFVVDCLALGRSCVGHLIGTTSIESIQALFLLSVCLKCNDEISAASAIIDLCVSAATSMGLGKSKLSGSRKLSTEERELRLKMWSAIYCFEKFLSFELGRASCISDDESGYLCKPVACSKPSEDVDYLSVIVSLAKVLGRIGHRCVKAHGREVSAGKEELDAAIVNKVETAGESCALLLEWADSLPPDLRPTSDMLSGSSSFSVASFISIQYNNALIMLQRNCLLISREDFRLAVEVIGKNKPWQFVVRNGQSIVVNAARRIIQVLIEAEDCGQIPLFPTYSTPLHAMYILIVNLISQPDSRMSKTDLELLSNAADFVRQYYEDLGRAGQAELILRKAEKVAKKAVGQVIASIKSKRISGTGESIERARSRASRKESVSNEVLSQPAPSEFSASSLGLADDLSVSIVSPSQEWGWSPALPDEIGCDWSEFVNTYTAFSSNDL